MKGVILSIMFSLKGLIFNPPLPLVRTGDFSTEGFAFLSPICLVYVDFSRQVRESHCKLGGSISISY